MSNISGAGNTALMLASIVFENFLSKSKVLLSTYQSMYLTMAYIFFFSSIAS